MRYYPLFIIVCPLLFIGCSPASKVAYADNRSVDYIQVYHIPWSYQPRIPFTEENAKRMRGSEKHIIDDNNEITLVMEALEGLAEIPNFSPFAISVYVHCLVCYADGRVEVINLTKAGVLNYNGHYFRYDSYFLDLLKVSRAVGN